MALRLGDGVERLPGIGPARARSLEKLGLATVEDLLRYFPRDYEDRRRFSTVAAAPVDTPVCLELLVAEPPHLSRIRKGLELVKARLVDDTGSVTATFFNQSYMKDALRTGETYVVYGRVEGPPGRRQMTNPVCERADRARFTGRILPIYPLTRGISNNLLAGLTLRCVEECAGQMEETLPAGLRREHALAAAEFACRNIHFPRDEEALELARRRLIFEELFCLACGMALLRTRRTCAEGVPFSTPPVEEFLALLPFSLTAAQRRAMEEVAVDTASGAPMNRLVQGDVGSGKTMVAAYGAWLAAKNGGQCALMAPTELLAEQHFRSLAPLLGRAGVRVGLLTGSVKGKARKELYAALAAGEVDLVVGTHALLSEGVVFSDLALAITDEQHRFGVAQRAALAAKAGRTPHVLVMSATPIPRTLALIIYGDLEVSVIDELPPGRTPVETYVVGEDKRQRMYRFVRKLVGQGRQAYLVCPAVEEGEESPGEPGGEGLKAAVPYAEHLKSEVFPDLRVGLVHGKMKARDKDAAMTAFAAGELDVLVSTTVIEVGVDVPNAALMVVENADRFGLSQLHQLRGRVGRSTRRAAAYLTYRPSKVLTEDQSKRLSAIREYAAFGSGFKIAMRDLEIRGAGNLLGPEQSGFLMSVGYDLYLRLLEEAVLEEQGKPVVRETLCTADFAVAAAIPERYIPAPEQRMDLYRRIARVRTQEEGDDITDELIDRYGDPPVGVANLIAIALLRARAASLGITELVQKEGSLRFSLPQPDFAKVAAVCGLEKYKGRLLFSAGDKPYLSLRLKKGDDVLKLAGIVLRDFEAAG